MKKEILKLENICYSYNKNNEALKDINLSIYEGEDVAIIGHNGSGKSTLGLIITSLIKPKSGKLIFKEQEINYLDDSFLRSKVGIVFQNPDNQFIGATVEEDIAFGLENKNIPHDEMVKIVEKYAKKLGVYELLKKEPQNLSGGQKQRVALASILAMKPDLIVFDEALSMIDPSGKNLILSLIKEIKEENPTLTIIRITHDLDEAFLADRILLISNGKLLLDDKPISFFSNKLINELKIDKPFIFKLNEGLLKEKIIKKPVYDLDKLGDLLCK